MIIATNPVVVRIVVFKSHVCSVAGKFLDEKAVMTPEDLGINYTALETKYPSSHILFYTEGGLEINLQEAEELLGSNFQKK
jgi:hypothetical protein